MPITIRSIVQSALRLIRRIGKAAPQESARREAYPWQRVQGRYAEVFYLPATSNPEAVEDTVRDCDEILERVVALLGAGPIAETVRVYIYPDEAAFQRCAGYEGTPFTACAKDSVVSLTWKPRQKMSQTLAHELTHVISEQLITGDAVGVFMEGLAMYVECKLFPRSSLPPVPCLDVPLQILADPTSFWTYLADWRTSSSTYYHVHSFVLYLTHLGGVDCFLNVFKEAAGGTSAERAERLTTAIRCSYGLDLQDIEQQWRRDSVVTEDGELLCREWLSPTLRAVIHKAQNQARHGSTAVEAAHLFGAILSYRQSIACQVICLCGAIGDVFQHIENNPVRKQVEQDSPIAWTSAARQSMAFAIDEARSFKCTYIGTEQLLMGLLRQNAISADAIFRGLELDVETFRGGMSNYYANTTPRE